MSNKNEKKQGSGKPKELFFLVWRIEWTLLEKHILQLLQEKEACSDEDIAVELCLDAGDVADIIGDDDGLGDYVQGDNSRRTLARDFTQKEWRAMDAKGSSPYPLEARSSYCPKAYLEYFEQLHQIHSSEISSEELKEERADKYYRYTPGTPIPDSLKELKEQVEGFFEDKKPKNRKGD